MPKIGPLRLRVENNINNQADCLVHQTYSELELCKATNPCLIKAGINSRLYEKHEKQQLRAVLGFRDDTVNVLFAGRFAPQKGICYAIEAMTRTSIHHHFRLVGDYSSMPELIALNAPNLEFLGPKTQSELAKYMIASDVFIMPSLYEPFGITAIEAMAAGCCLIVTATGGLDEIVQNGVNGFKVPPGNSTAILEEFEKLNANPEKMAEMRKTNINEAKMKYSWHVTAKNIKLEIDKLVKNGH